MNEKDQEIVNSYKKGETPVAVRNNVSNKNGKVTVKDGKTTIREGILNPKRK